MSLLSHNEFNLSFVNGAVAMKEWNVAIKYMHIIENLVYILVTLGQNLRFG